MLEVGVKTRTKKECWVSGGVGSESLQQGCRQARVRVRSKRSNLVCRGAPGVQVQLAGGGKVLRVGQATVVAGPFVNSESPGGFAKAMAWLGI